MCKRTVAEGVRSSLEEVEWCDDVERGDGGGSID